MRKLLLPIFVLPFIALSQGEIKYTVLNEELQTPNIIVLNDGYYLNENEISPFLSTKLRLSSGESFIELKRKTYSDGRSTIKFIHTLNGSEVYGDIYIAHLRNGLVTKFNGQFTPNVEAINPSFNSEIAIQHALNYFSADVYNWELEPEEELIKRIKKDPDATYYPQPKLTYIKVGDETKLTYKMDIRSITPLKGEAVFVDAQNGNIVKTLPLFHDIDKPAVGISRFSDTVSIMTDEVSAGIFRLTDNTRGGGIETYDLYQTTNYGSAVEFNHGDTIWDIANSNDDDVAIDAHWGAEMTYDYFQQKHSRDSYDANGTVMLSYVHYDVNWSNAMWTGDRMSYGDGSVNGNPYIGLDIVGHEISHGVTQFTSGLEYQGESGALNESFSDIFGNTIEYFADSNRANWHVGEQCFNSLRNMANPKDFGNPDTYDGIGWSNPNGAFDNGGVHNNSGVQNFWYYLLVEGGTGINDNGDSFFVSPMGWDVAGEIAYRNQDEYLTVTSKYIDARDYSLQATADMFGSCSPEVHNVAEAWFAVGVGDRLDAQIDPDFLLNYSYACSLPLTIDFSNLTTQQGVFTWNFGDGGLSFLENPSHSYTDPGLYTITLEGELDNECHTNTASISKTLNLVAIGSPNEPLCEPTVKYNSNSMGINRVMLNGLDYESGLEDNDYNDYTCKSNTLLHIDSTYEMTIYTSQGTSENARAWIDFNEDGDFSADELIFSSDSKYGTHQEMVSFTGINTVFNHPLRMRVISDILFNHDIQPCNELQYGQAEDYSVAMVKGDGTLSTDDLLVNNEAIKIYPNPATDQLNIKLNSGEILKSVEVIDILGKTVISTNQSSINVEKLADGIYTVRANTNKNTYFDKIVKN